ncbi:hypothetical protein EV421DRAFT_1791236 [Armillaria borealis]|uniref:REJ domain-containing protein n=1 Tax=Armillaria borealis TaxID=47425 RepID=A0AA39MUX9_9AGAR|nr:hypothetical protein EV421DRAFT_1791236 [Armillaria borealis]
MLDATSKTLFLFFLFLVPVRGAPAPQATDVGSFDSLLREISSFFTDTATSTGPFTEASSTNSGDPASTTETYVTRVSLVGGTEITLAPSGATGDTTVLGSSTYTLAAPTSSDSSLSSQINDSTMSSDSSSSSISSASSSSSSSTSSTSSPTSSSSSTNSSPSSTSTSSSSSSSTSTNKPSSSSSNTSSSSSSGSSSTSSSTTSPSSYVHEFPYFLISSHQCHKVTPVSPFVPLRCHPLLVSLQYC